MSNKRNKTYEAPDMAAAISRMTRGLTRRAAEGDLEALSALAEAERAAHLALEAAGAAAHDHGYSWTEIARELGITRQAAQHRFGNDAA